VTNMHLMFSMATSFDGDISRWDVSRVTNMKFMFMNAPAFNVDISKWDVSRVTNMDSMFWEAISFKQKLCGDAWGHSTASKKGMFTGSRGSISREVCTSTTRRQDVTRRPLTERELQIVRASITTPVSTSTLALVSSNTIACLKCGMFKKSGRVSCCAPGGGWYKNCGGADNRNADHKWFEGVEACKCKSKPQAK
jgi:surface protein